MIVVAVEGANILANTLVLELEELVFVAAVVVVKHPAAAVADDSSIGFSGNSEL